MQVQILRELTHSFVIIRSDDGTRGTVSIQRFDATLESPRVKKLIKRFNTKPTTPTRKDAL